MRGFSVKSLNDVDNTYNLRVGQETVNNDIAVVMGPPLAYRPTWIGFKLLTTVKNSNFCATLIQ